MAHQIAKVVAVGVYALVSAAVTSAVLWLLIREFWPRRHDAAIQHRSPESVVLTAVVFALQLLNTLLDLLDSSLLVRLPLSLRIWMVNELVCLSWLTAMVVSSNLRFLWKYSRARFEAKSVWKPALEMAVRRALVLYLTPCLRTRNRTLLACLLFTLVFGVLIPCTLLSQMSLRLACLICMSVSLSLSLSLSLSGLSSVLCIPCFVSFGLCFLTLWSFCIDSKQRTPASLVPCYCVCFGRTFELAMSTIALRCAEACFGLALPHCVGLLALAVCT